MSPPPSALPAAIDVLCHQANQDVSDPHEVQQRLADAADADAFIRESIVQARRTPMGTYGACVSVCRSKQGGWGGGAGCWLRLRDSWWQMGGERAVGDGHTSALHVSLRQAAKR